MIREVDVGLHGILDKILPLDVGLN
jgi:hypothetical protein